MNNHTDKHTNDHELKEQHCGFSAVKGVCLGATIGMCTSIAAVGTAYAIGYKYQHNYVKALRDGMFDMAFDTVAGGLFGGVLQYWQSKQWNQMIDKHKNSAKIER